MHISASYRNIIRCLIEIHPVIIEKKYRQTSYRQADRPSGSFIPCKLSFWGFNYLENKGFSTPFPDDKILHKSKLKAFADDKLKLIQMAKFVLDKTENIVGKEENAGYQHFLHFPHCFQKALFQDR